MAEGRRAIASTLAEVDFGARAVERQLRADAREPPRTEPRPHRRGDGSAHALRHGRPQDQAVDATRSIAARSRKYSIGNGAGLVTERIETSSSLRAKNPWTAPRGVRPVMRDAMRALEAERAAELGADHFEQFRGLLLGLDEMTHGAPRR